MRTKPTKMLLGTALLFATANSGWALSPATEQSKEMTTTKPIEKQATAMKAKPNFLSKKCGDERTKP